MTKKLVMLVEDEDPIRLLGRRVLESQGYAVEDYAHGLSAFRRLVELHSEGKTSYYKLIISDIDMMPQMNGIAFAEEASKITDSPVVLMTGRPRESYPACVKEVLHKPFSINEYKRVLEEYTN